MGDDVWREESQARRQCTRKVAAMVSCWLVSAISVTVNILLLSYRLLKIPIICKSFPGLNMKARILKITQQSMAMV